MRAHHIEFLELLNEQVQYVVPRWQRRYRWGQADIDDAAALVRQHRLRARQAL